MYNREWYNSLQKSPLTPPNWVFGVAWTILYILLICSFILTVINKKCKSFCKPLIFFVIQLILNLLWTTIFFKWKKIIIAFIVIIVIIILTIITIILMRKITKIGAYILIPYVLWLCFASYLNGYIIANNKIE